MLQSFSTSPYFRGNPDLKPERSRAVEIGVDQRLANDRVKLSELVRQSLSQHHRSQANLRLRVG